MIQNFMYGFGCWFPEVNISEIFIIVACQMNEKYVFLIQTRVQLS